ncbi:TSUP family transporter [Thiohalocapsa marina]|uniref:Probable membrane transporter protein n=1 Tax=Thiohalocapsa marina TaxID=424902 RepID=A0A5M8FRW3_9GAMM|nr:sulfite exporter TauE/SafE family protein [Thiohalocapsa marina]KAA6184252.1 TSUP family transporter [Thiohalocapsa marina]
MIVKAVSDGAVPALLLSGLGRHRLPSIGLEQPWFVATLASGRIRSLRLTQPRQTRSAHVTNGLKLLISNLVSVAALILFGLQGATAWGEGGLVLFGTLAGGYVAAHLSRQIPPGWVKGFVILVGAGITAYFFAETDWIVA